MNLRFISFIVLLISVMSTEAQDGKEPSQPNIVVFLCDDLGYGDLSSYGHRTIKTPNIDKLAETGIKMTDFYSAAPVYSPSILLSGSLAPVNSQRVGRMSKAETTASVVPL